MTDKTSKNIILNSKLADSSSKIIFEDNTLCAQFLRDYIDLPYLENVQPEDIEDVSEQYVTLFSEERNADRVKKVQIANEKPLFLISLIEHKSSVDYTVSMQIFRYMIHIWERYEREAEKIKKDITKRADFKYPPILPIVYYEGDKTWTVPLDFRSKIMAGDIFGKYVPNFEYYLVPLRKYSNKELLAKKDEISLVMMINRMQNQKDVEEFQKLPQEEVAEILRETPEYLLNIISNVLKAFLLKMNYSVEETEEMVGKVKEKKMGILFENVEPFDIELERKKYQAEKRKADKAKVEAEEEKRKAEEEKRKAEEEKQRADAIQRQMLELQLALQEERIQILIETCQELADSQENVMQRLQSRFLLSKEDAEQSIQKYWKK